MKLRHEELEASKDNPFKNCKLDRRKYGEILTEIVKSYSDGFVLSIDSKWGTGKTTFVKMWQQELEKQDFKTLYFNAWVNDFDSNPLVAILSGLKTLNIKSKDRTFNSLLSKGAVIAKNTFPALVKAISKNYIDLEAVTDAIENVTKSAVDILKDEVDDYAKKKKGLVDFKKELESFVEKNAGKTPLIFIVDELDRCRPDYAVEVLED